MQKILLITSLLTITVGVFMILGGIWGIFFTYKNVARESITTPPDASIPSTKVRGPLTLKAQSDIIRQHVLHTTEGKTYAQMPQTEARNIWITATTLITALNLGIVSYALSGIVMFVGVLSILIGIILFIK
ncbi:MAG: hypothetical protein KBD47_00595 [Candidatus Pacebacteria bacterium]|nr:hypothetical protein [Candidatus Paceibacterota bacterium]